MEHKQHKNIHVNKKRGLNVGGIVVPITPTYWSSIYGIGGQTTVTDNDSHEGAGNDHDADDIGSSAAGTAAGVDASGQM